MTTAPKMHRHRCFCCVGTTQHESGPCVTCGSLGYFLDREETLPHFVTVQHRHIIHIRPTCKLTDEERRAAIRFIAAGEPNTYEPDSEAWSREETPGLPAGP